MKQEYILDDDSTLCDPNSTSINFFHFNRLNIFNVKDLNKEGEDEDLTIFHEP